MHTNAGVVEYIVLFFSDYHKKQNVLKALRKKALERNPDEFYFKMTRMQLQVRVCCIQTEWLYSALGNGCLGFFCLKKKIIMND